MLATFPGLSGAGAVRSSRTYPRAAHVMRSRWHTPPNGACRGVLQPSRLGWGGSPTSLLGARFAASVAVAASRAAGKAGSNAAGKPPPKATKGQLLEQMTQEMDAGVREEAMETWSNRMRKLRKPVACKMRDSTIDLDHPLGISPTRAMAGGSLQCLKDFVNAKLKHPQRVVLTRIGAFYEAIGFDAVMLVEVCGLSPTSLDKGLPKAGLPAANLSKEIETLLGADLEMVIVEQFMNGSDFERDIAKVVTLASPSYKAPDVELPGMYMSSQPVVGVSWSARGAQLMLLDVEQRLLRRVEALSDEALLGIISSTGVAALLLHINPQSTKGARKADADAPALFKQRMKELLVREAIHTITYEHADPVAGFKAAVAVMLGQASAVDSEEQLCYDELQRLRPLYPGTARQLGLLQTEGMPSLLLAMVSEAAPAEVRRMWRHHLMVPPSVAVAAHVRHAVGILVAMGCGTPSTTAAEVADPAVLLAGQGFPDLSASVSFDKVLAILPNSSEPHRAADDRFLRELRDMLVKLGGVLDSPRPELQQLVDHAWPWVQEQVRITASREELREACQRALNAISALVPEGDFQVALFSSASDDEDAAAAAAAAATTTAAAEAAAATPSARTDINPDAPPAAKSRAKGRTAAKRIKRPALEATPFYKQQNLLQPWETYLWHTRGSFARRVIDEAVPEEAAAVDKAQEQLRLVLVKMWEGAEHYTQQQELVTKLLPSGDHLRFVVDINSGPALWMQWGADMKGKLGCMQDAGAAYAFTAPDLDARGDKLSAKRDAARAKSITCPALQDATSNFLDAVDAAVRAADERLLQLTAQLAAERLLLAAAANLSVALVALYEHVKMGCSSGWSIPEVEAPPEGKRTRVLTGWRQHKVAASPTAAVRDSPTAASRSSSSSTSGSSSNSATGCQRPAGRMGAATAAGAATPAAQAELVPGAAGADAFTGGISSPIKIEGMFPYWLPKIGDIGSAKTVLNDVYLDSSMLLTGPNMAGKSTVLRSIAAVCLLASSGCMVPANAAFLPWLDAVILRNFSGDSPKEGRSAFAMEMADMSYVLKDATNCSLVLVDELGKGTEARAGAALSAALLEVLDVGRAFMVFATHLHLLLQLQLEVVHMTRWRMMVEEQPGRDGLPRRLVPTWRLAPGECTESLALEVAQDQGVPSDVLERAAQLYQQLLSSDDMMPDLSRQAPGLSTGRSSSSSRSSSSNWAGAQASLLQTKVDSLTTAGQEVLLAIQPLLVHGTGDGSSSGMTADQRLRVQRAVQQMQEAMEAGAAGVVPVTTATPVLPATEAPASRKAQRPPPTQEQLESACNVISKCVASHFAPSVASTQSPAAADHAGSSSSSGNVACTTGTFRSPVPEACASSSSSSSSSSSTNTGSEMAAAQHCHLFVLGRGQKLPPTYHAQPVVYAVLYGDRWADVGQSRGMAAGGVRQTKEGVEARLKKAAKRRKIDRDDLVAVIVPCPNSDVSSTLEGVVGRALQDKGWKLMRSRDAKLKG